MLVLRENNEPFATDKAAKMFAGRRKWFDAEIVPYEGGGYAVDVSEDLYKEWKSSEEDAKEKKHVVTSPWKPATLLSIPENLKDKGYVYRFCNKKTEGNIQKKIAEGWEIDKELSKKLNSAPTIEDGKPIDGTLHVRELVVMRMRKELKESRDKYFRDLANGSIGSANIEMREKAGQMGIETYDETEQTMVSTYE